MVNCCVENAFVMLANENQRWIISHIEYTTIGGVANGTLPCLPHARCKFQSSDVIAQSWSIEFKSDKYGLHDERGRCKWERKKHKPVKWNDREKKRDWFIRLRFFPLFSLSCYQLFIGYWQSSKVTNHTKVKVKLISAVGKMLCNRLYHYSE